MPAEKLGNFSRPKYQIWYEALRKLTAKSEFQKAAETTVRIAGTRYDSATAKVVRDAWA
jgi:Zn-dependent metalloprotease